MKSAGLRLTEVTFPKKGLPFGEIKTVLEELGLKVKKEHDYNSTFNSYDNFFETPGIDGDVRISFSQYSKKPTDADLVNQIDIVLHRTTQPPRKMKISSIKDFKQFMSDYMEQCRAENNL